MEEIVPEKTDDDEIDNADSDRRYLRTVTSTVALHARKTELSTFRSKSTKSNQDKIFLCLALAKDSAMITRARKLPSSSSLTKAIWKRPLFFLLFHWP